MNAPGCVHLLKVHLHTITTGAKCSVATCHLPVLLSSLGCRVPCPGAFGRSDPIACSWAVVSSPDTGLLAFLRFGD